MNTDTNSQQDNNKNPDLNPSKAMDSKKEVENSKDEKTDQDFPGYPHYPAREDVMNPENDLNRVDADVENFPSSNATGVSQRFLAGQNEEDKKDIKMSDPTTDNEIDNNEIDNNEKE